MLYCFSIKPSGVIVLLRGILSAVLFLSLSLPVCAGEIISVAGDPCTVPVMEKLAEAFAIKYDTYFSLASGPCMSGVKKVADGEVMIGVSTQNIEPPEGCSNTVIAKAPIVLIVNKKNKVKNLSQGQLKEIFPGEITNWKEVG